MNLTVVNTEPPSRAMYGRKGVDYSGTVTIDERPGVTYFAVVNIDPAGEQAVVGLDIFAERGRIVIPLHLDVPVEQIGNAIVEASGRDR